MARARLPSVGRQVEIVASLVLLADRRAGRRSDWLPWPPRPSAQPPAWPPTLPPPTSTASSPDGCHLTRDAIAARLWRQRPPLRNARLTLLLQALRCEIAS